MSPLIPSRKQNITIPWYQYHWKLIFLRLTHCASPRKLSQEGRRVSYGSPARRFHRARKNPLSAHHIGILRAKRGSNSSFRVSSFLRHGKGTKNIREIIKNPQKIVHYNDVNIIYCQNAETPVNKGFSGFSFPISWYVSITEYPFALQNDPEFSSFSVSFLAIKCDYWYLKC